LLIQYEAKNRQLGKEKGITVNVVAPGGVMTDALLALPEADLNNLQTICRQLTKAADRMGTIEDIADVVLFVASEKSRWITGHVFAAGGGINDN
jgi:NAD(P)-dependent dehydrogenase (short-subunit alcohol dehydrogenase family)